MNSPSRRSFGLFRRSERELLLELIEQGQWLMAGITELDAAIAGTSAAVDAAAARVIAAIAAASIPLDLQPQVDAVNAVAAKIATIAP